MPTYGVTAAGFVSKDLSQILAEVQADLQNIFGASIDLSPTEPFGELAGILAEREAAIWDLMEEVYASQYPDSAAGSSLVNICALTGTLPLPPTRSFVTATLTGTPGTTIAQGKQASVATAGTKFRTTAEVVIGGGGTVDVVMESVDTGPKAANAGTLTVIETPVAGWSSVTNALDAVPGRAAETDAALRLRREAELRTVGNAALDAIRADVLAATVGGQTFVSACKVFQNVTDTTDGAGLPPHSINVVAGYAGAPDSAKDNAIRAAIFGSAAGGIETHGSVTGTVTDDSGNAQEVDFDRPTDKNVWIIVNVTTDPATWPADGATQIKNALVAYAGRYGLGDDVVVSKLYAPITDNVDGIVDVTAILVGFSNPPVASANLAIGTREQARFDTSRISVVAV